MAPGSGRITIDLDALAENWRTLQAHVGGACTVAAVVKADGYGLGMVPVATALAEAGCRRFFVAVPAEGVALAAALLPSFPAVWIGVLSGPMPDTRERLMWPLDRALVPVLNTLDQVRIWRDHAPDRDALLHFDTGMGRLGLTPIEAERLLESGWLGDMSIIGIMSHLACADEPGNPTNDRQRALFDRLTERFPARIRSLAASSGTHLGPAFRYDMVRVGAALYGVNPTPGRVNPMRQVVTMDARILQIRELQAGETVGYGQSWTARRPTRLATIAIGYADGLIRNAGNAASCRIGRIAAPLVGRISMDLATLDISDLPPGSLEPGGVVRVIGPDYDLDAFARDSGTIAYEVLTRLGGRLSRHYVSAGT